jgi:hypothetical protein
MASGRTREQVIRIGFQISQKILSTKERNDAKHMIFREISHVSLNKKGKFRDISFCRTKEQAKFHFVSFLRNREVQNFVAYTVILRYFFQNTTKRETDGCYGKLWQAEQIKRHFIRHFCVS